MTAGIGTTAAITIVVEDGIAAAAGIVVIAGAGTAAGVTMAAVIAGVGRKEDAMNANNDIVTGMFIIGILVVFSPLSPQVTATLLAITSAYFFMTGMRAVSSHNTGNSSRSFQNRSYARRESREEPIQQTSSTPIKAGLTIAEQIRKAHAMNSFKCPNCGATIKNVTDRKCRHCDSVLVDMTSLPSPETWADVEIGQNIRILRGNSGEINSDIVYRVFYAELWQEKMKTDVPWTLTGSYFVGLGLSNDMFLLNWQSRYYLLNIRNSLTDMDINREFAQYARKFAASNQTATVVFNRGGTQWKIFDIGRFRIEFTEGDDLKVSPGAIGRFIHAKSDDQILVVEDFQSGGNGRDTLWIGYEITAKDIKL